MPQLRLAALIVVVGLGTPLVIRAQTEPDKQQQEAVQKDLSWLTEHQIDRKHFPKAMPLAKFLDAVQKQLPKDKKISLRIDKDAFGAKYDAVAATPIMLPPNVSRLSLGWLLDVVATKIKADYRIGAAEIAITTPERAFFTADYDLRDVTAKPEVVGLADPEFRNADPAKRAALVGKRLLDALEEPSAEAGETYQILNGTRLVVRATGTRQAQFVSVLRAFTRLGDLAIVTTTQLYEVDDAFYTKLKNAKHIPLKELERLFLDGKLPKSWLSDLLPKQKLLQTSAAIKVDNRVDAMVLARQNLVRCLPSPEQIRKGEKTRQTIVEGVSFHANFQVSPDRRFIQMKLTEKAAEIQRIEKVKVTTFEEFGKDPPAQDVFAEVAAVKETTQSQTRELADGGSIFMPVHCRPRSVQAANRWWVLLITSRIIIEEEERQIKEDARVPKCSTSP